MSITDFLGQEIGVGDKVIYAAQSGRAVNMIFAEVVSFSDSGSVTVTPLKSSRWKQHHGTMKWIDKRTGKGIDPYCASGKHLKSKGGYVWADTGERLTDEELSRYRAMNPWGGRDREIKPVASVFKDYVERVNGGPGPVTLKVAENIVKWNGEGAE